VRVGREYSRGPISPAATNPEEKISVTAPDPARNHHDDFLVRDVVRARRPRTKRVYAIPEGNRKLVNKLT
jgi:hypothetical protein